RYCLAEARLEAELSELGGDDALRLRQVEPELRAAMDRPADRHELGQDRSRGREQVRGRGCAGNPGRRAQSHGLLASPIAASKDPGLAGPTIRFMAMRAVVQDRYGPPEVLHIAEVERPTPKAGEVLIRVQASTVSQTDTHIRAAHPFFWRLIGGFRRPRWAIRGVDLAGVVEGVGPGVTEFA